MNIGEQYVTMGELLGYFIYLLSFILLAIAFSVGPSWLTYIGLSWICLLLGRHLTKTTMQP